VPYCLPLRQLLTTRDPQVSVYSDEALTYIVSILPGTVLAVKAMRTLDGVQKLMNVPSDLYTVQTKTYGTITAVQIVVKEPLSTLTTAETKTKCGVKDTVVTVENQGWADDLYVTFKSNVGPDIIDILTYIIDNYTDLDWDAESFEYCRTKLARFPANFPILERKNTIEVLRDIAFQCRCAIWLDNGVFYLRYLPEKPVAVDVIEVSDLDSEKGIEVSLTPTEDLVTKMKVKWRLSWAPDENEYVREADKHEKLIILRHNIARYGTQEKEYDQNATGTSSTSRIDQQGGGLWELQAAVRVDDCLGCEDLQGIPQGGRRPIREGPPADDSRFEHAHLTRGHRWNGWFGAVLATH
jgi:hypothetical protein